MVLNHTSRKANLQEQLVQRSTLYTVSEQAVLLSATCSATLGQHLSASLPCAPQAGWLLLLWMWGLLYTLVFQYPPGLRQPEHVQRLVKHEGAQSGQQIPDLTARCRCSRCVLLT